MAIFNIEVNLDWLEDGENIDQVLKNAVVANLQDRISSNVQKQVEKELTEKISERADEIVDEYLDKTLRNTIENLKIPYKSGAWNSNIEYIPLSEFVGKRYETFLTERKLDEHGNLTNYSHEAKHTFADYLLKNYFEKEVAIKVNSMLQTARKDAELMIVKTLESNLKEQLSVDIIKRLNIPDMLKSLQDKAALLEVKEVQK